MSETTRSENTTSDNTIFENESGRSGANGSNTIRDTAAEATQSAKEQLSAAKEQVSAAAQPVTDKARSLAEEQKQTSAARVQGVAGAVHSAADEIGKEVPQLAGYVHSGAEQLERAARVLRENSVDELLQMTQRLAHDRPFAFIGGSVAAGFILARFLKSSGSMFSTEDLQP